MRIESLHNPRVQELLKLKTDKSFRHEKNKIFVEGKKLIEEIPSSFSGTLYLVEDVPLHPDWHRVFISEKVAEKLSDTPHPEGIFAEIAHPQESELLEMPLLVLDGVSDPGNLGTLLRTACAFGFKGVYFLPGCCDPFNPKVLRSSKGALFKLAYRTGSLEMLTKFAEKNGAQMVAGDLSGDRPECIEGNRFMLFLGNEGLGLSPAAKKLVRRISIPMPGEMESLNVGVAGGILMYLLTAKR